MNLNAMTKGLAGLCEKYAAPAGGRFESEGRAFRPAGGDAVPLLPGRAERRFVELKKIVDGGTLEGVSTLRFAAMRGGVPLRDILVREIDLAAWLGGAPFVSVCAVLGGDLTADVVGRLANGLNVSLECSAALPAGARPIDRHEIIARRGVACDRVVDSQVPQDSIYRFTAAGEERFTDTDMELYGLAAAEINLVRAAFELLTHPERASEWAAAAARAERVADGVFASGGDFAPVAFKEEK